MEINDLGKEIISTDHPAGSDISYDDDYEKLGNEIKKLSSPTADSIINWATVVDLSKTILAEKSKNLQVCCYLSIALCQTEGLNGCATGIHILRELLDTFWDTLYPPKKRKKGRINALSWWNEKIRDFIDIQEPQTWDTDKRAQLINDLSNLDTFIGDKLPDGPILRPLIEAISDLIQEPQKAPAQEPQRPEESAVKSSPPVTEKKDTGHTTAPAAAPAVKAVTIPTTTESLDAEDYFTTGRDFLCTAADQFFTQDYHNPISYQLNRLAAWSEINSLPPASKGITMLPPPDEQAISLLKSQYESQLWSPLLTSAEGHIRQYLFWLDLSFWVATALEHLQADNAAQMVASNTCLFVKRLKPLETLSFSDGTPFASAETREWLMNLTNPGHDSPAPLSSGGNDADIRQNGTMQILADKGLQEALHSLQENSGSLRSGKSKFIHDLTSCRLLLKGKQAELSRPFADRLLEQVDTMGLESWDPDLAFTAIHTAYTSLKLAPQDETQQQVTALRHRLTLLAPEKMLNSI